MSAASKGLQNRKKYNTSNIYTVERFTTSKNRSNLFPDLPFLGVYVKTKENYPKHQGFLPPRNTRKTLEKQKKMAENTPNTKQFPWLERPRNNKTLSRGQKINATCFCTKFCDNPSGHGRLRRKSWTSAPKSAFSCSPGDGEKLFDPWASGRKGQECPREIWSKKFMFMLLFSSLNQGMEDQECSMLDYGKDFEKNGNVVPSRKRS